MILALTRDKIVYVHFLASERHECSHIFPSVLTSASCLWMKRECRFRVMQSQQGLVARAIFIKELPYDLCFLWTFLYDVSAVRSEVLPGFLSSKQSSFLWSLRPTGSRSEFQKKNKTWAFSRKDTLVRPEILTIDNKSLVLQTRPLLFCSHFS